MALTDHDTTEGWDEARDAAVARGMSFIPGVELSTKTQGRSVHLLAYLPDPEDAVLTDHMLAVRADRIGRAERMVAAIAADYDFGWDDVIAVSEPGATIGRPHIADALIARGIIPDRAAAFSTLLHPRGPYWSDHYSPTTAEMVQVVRAAGGVPIAAHPATASRSGGLSEDTLNDLVDVGLCGFEIDHRENTEEGKRMLSRIARARDLIVTGSSDYHGAGKPNRPGENTTSPEMVHRILERGLGTEPTLAPW